MITNVRGPFSPLTPDVRVTLLSPDYQCEGDFLFTDPPICGRPSHHWPPKYEAFTNDDHLIRDTTYLTVCVSFNSGGSLRSENEFKSFFIVKRLIKGFRTCYSLGLKLTDVGICPEHCYLIQYGVSKRSTWIPHEDNCKKLLMVWVN